MEFQTGYITMPDSPLDFVLVNSFLLLKRKKDRDKTKQRHLNYKKGWKSIKSKVKRERDVLRTSKPT